MSCVAPAHHTIWLQAPNYRVVPLNSRLAKHCAGVAAAIQKGVPAFPDHARGDFYELKLQDGWSYVHVHDAAETVYLVACSQH